MTKSGPIDAGMTTVTVRLPKKMIDRLDAYAGKYRTSTMGAPYTRSDAVRDLILEGLERAAKTAGKKAD